MPGLIFVFLVETRFRHVGQAGPELLTSGDPLASASQSADYKREPPCLARKWFYCPRFANEETERLREVRRLAQGHTGSLDHCRDSNPGSLPTPHEHPHHSSRHGVAHLLQESLSVGSEHQVGAQTRVVIGQLLTNTSIGPCQQHSRSLEAGWP